MAGPSDKVTGSLPNVYAGESGRTPGEEGAPADVCRAATLPDRYTPASLPSPPPQFTTPMILAPARGRGKPGFNIGEARKALERDDPGQALSYLATILRLYIRDGDPASANALLDEAKRIMSKYVKDHSLYMWELRMAEHAHALGRLSDVEEIFSRVLSYPGRVEGQTGQGGLRYAQDGIRFAVAHTYLKIDRPDEAYRVASGIKDRPPGFSIFLQIAEKYARSGKIEDAARCLTVSCAGIARLWTGSMGSVGQISRTELLLIVAEKLFEIGRNDDAKSILKELSDHQVEKEALAAKMRLIAEYWPDVAQGLEAWMAQRPLVSPSAALSPPSTEDGTSAIRLTADAVGELFRLPEYGNLLPKRQAEIARFIDKTLSDGGFRQEYVRGGGITPAGLERLTALVRGSASIAAPAEPARPERSERPAGADGDGREEDAKRDKGAEGKSPVR
ncbi:MAG: hypothetical protein V2A66_03520 [Pseudomonadota bacterium]